MGPLDPTVVIAAGIATQRSTMIRAGTMGEAPDHQQNFAGRERASSGTRRGGLAPRPLTIAPGDRLDRYHVRRLLGSGGAGRVYAAFDPELDREVAIKIVNVHGGAAGRGSAGRQRLIREARAMASLSHPNVAEVHHVGELQGGVFIVMELLPGGTLTEWIFDQRRGWSEILEKFIGAGQGLAHAHTHGIVHRDFKPENVLLRADGTPRVVDFGLARREDRPTPSVEPSADVDTLEPISGHSSLLGTPAYMAPEQHLGEEVDARADQFAFAVALYEALWGRRPFRGRTLTELAVAVTTMPPDPPPVDHDVPRRVWRTLRRALSRERHDRWPSIHVLLATLEHDPRPSRRWLWSGAGVAAVGAAAISFAPEPLAGPHPCDVGAARVDALWTPARRDGIRQVFADTKAAEARGAARAVGDRIDGWATSWQDTYASSCRDESDPAMACLNRQLEKVEALLAVLEEADATVIERARELAAHVPEPSVCTEPSEQRRYQAPIDPETAEAIATMHRDVATIGALESAGRVDAALARAEALAARATEDAPARVRAQAHYQLGRMRERKGDYEGALAELTEAALLADASDLTWVAVEAGIELTYLAGYRLSRPDDGLRWARTTHAALDRVGGDPTLQARLLTNEATILAQRGEYKEALDRFERARASYEQSGRPNHPNVGTNLINIGLMHYRLGRPREAEPHLTRAVQILEATRGPEHPLVASALNNLGIALEHQGRTEEARSRYQQALELRERVLGPDHPSLASALNNLASVVEKQGDRERAIQLVRRALEIREHAHGEDHPRTALTVSGLAGLLGRAGQTEESLSLHRRAIAAHEAAHGAEHPEVASSLVAMGTTLLRAGRGREALEPLQRALEIRLEVLDPSHREVAVTRLRIGEALASAGDLAAALPWFEQARPVLLRELAPDHPDVASVLAGPRARHRPDGPLPP